ncbi:hypothetical protein MUCCIDRAFT_105769 [Mucor lusitanicus CBS 277.49]|uniref:Uncharacterized protein n=1 Tax=Mucor lusitanicus CBS 277.49 TaxID=747725 RepID=A0A162U1S6_MUCCL|nr:hypothetical protein MUCCIDRAFT_105769 [Mucor lusitanicus CBS 277.49]
MNLEAEFRIDLNGWLEYEKKYSSSLQREKPQPSDRLLEQLVESLELTLSYYKHSPKALMALHNTVFHNTIRNQDNAIDFNMVNFPNAIDHYTMYYICEHFGLHKYTTYELWKMQAQDALNFMMRTAAATNKPLRHLHPILFKLIQKNAHFDDITDQTLQQFIVDQIKVDDRAGLATHYLSDVLQTLYDCVLENTELAKTQPNQAQVIQDSTHRLSWFASSIPYLIMEKYPNVTISESCYSLIRSIFQLKGSPAPSYMLKVPEPKTITIPVQTCRNAREQQHDLKYDWHKLMKQQDANTTTHEQAFLVICWHLKSKRLVTNTQSLYDAEEKSGFDRLEKRIREKIVKNDVVKCQLWCIFSIRNRASFWKSTLKVVVQFMDLWIRDVVDTKCADIFAGLITREDLMVVLYDHILKHVQHYQRSNSQDTKLLINHLCQLLETCMANVQDKDDLIRFRDDILKQRREADGIHLPTFGSIDLWNIPFKSDLIKVCNQITADDDENGGLYRHGAPDDVVMKLIKQFTENHPIILTPNCLVPDQPTKMLLHLPDILNDFLLPPLTQFTRQPTAIDIQLIQFNLYLLDSFCQYKDDNDSGWQLVKTTHESDLPAVLYCSSETFVHCLTFIMNLREQDEKHGVRLQDWEAALNYIDKFTLIILYGQTAVPSQFRTLQQYFETSLTDFGWETQLLWYPLIRHRPLRVPAPFFRITGALNGIFEADIAESSAQQPTEGWRCLFRACKQSTELTDTLFQHQIQWEYNLLLLWKHPIENEILKDGLEHALHPGSSLSVSSEYPKLLNHFLHKLYDSFDFYPVLQDEQYYTDKSMLPIISRLSRHQGMRSYFVVLCIAQLLKPKQRVTEAKENNKPDLYYLSSLIKVIQDITHWGNISKDGQAPSYNKLKERLHQDTETDNASLEYYSYPLLNTEKLRSDRALAILTLYHLSSVDVDDTQLEVIQRLLMQIVEGLVDMESRQQFERMIQQQPKKRIANYKKRSKLNDSRCKKMRLQPILSNEEAALLTPVLLAQQAHAGLSQALGLHMCDSDDNDQDQKILYFL